MLPLFCIRATDARHRPVFSSATGQAVIPVPCSTKERAERIGEKPLSRPLASQASIPHPLEKDNGTRAVAQLRRAKIATTEPGPRKQSFRLRSARGWICRPAGCPRVKSLCLAPRSCGLPPGHSLVPSAPFAVVCLERLFRIRRPSKTPEAVKARGPPRPVPRRMTIAACSVSVRDTPMIFILGIWSRTKWEHSTDISDNQKLVDHWRCLDVKREAGSSGATLFAGATRLVGLHMRIGHAQQLSLIHI